MLEAAVEPGDLWVLQVGLAAEVLEPRAREGLEQLTQVEAGVVVSPAVGLAVQVL